MRYGQIQRPLVLAGFDRFFVGKALKTTITGLLGTFGPMEFYA
jgi:hypothetical protein